MYFLSILHKLCYISLFSDCKIAFRCIPKQVQFSEKVFIRETRCCLDGTLFIADTGAVFACGRYSISLYVCATFLHQDFFRLYPLFINFTAQSSLLFGAGK